MDRPLRRDNGSSTPAWHAGGEDRHGEMTGAISVNMVLCMPPVGAWAVFVGPWLFEALWPTLVGAVAMALVLPVAMLPVSRRIWLWLSRRMTDG